MAALLDSFAMKARFKIGKNIWIVKLDLSPCGNRVRLD